MTFFQIFYYFDAQTALFPWKWRFLTLKTVQFLKIFSARSARRCLAQYPPPPISGAVHRPEDKYVCQNFSGAEPPPQEKSWLRPFALNLLNFSISNLDISTCLWFIKMYRRPNLICPWRHGALETTTIYSLKSRARSCVGIEHNLMLIIFFCVFLFCRFLW